MALVRSVAGLSIARLAIAMPGAMWIWAQPPGPAPPPPPNRIADVQRKLATTGAVNSTAQKALSYGRLFLGSALRAEKAGQVFPADRMADAADSMIHVAEHQQHMQNGGGPAGPPPIDAINDHLQHVYFRVQQADYFWKQSGDRRAAALPRWAREFYQLAVSANERQDRVAADENAKCADEVVKCLEDLAQAATLKGPPAPGPPPPPPAPPV